MNGAIIAGFTQRKRTNMPHLGVNISYAILHDRQSVRERRRLARVYDSVKSLTQLGGIVAQTRLSFVPRQVEQHALRHDKPFGIPSDLRQLNNQSTPTASVSCSGVGAKNETAQTGQHPVGIGTN